ncbi:MAG: carbonic anhydrase [Alphaproteobacteria bacterium]
MRSSAFLRNGYAAFRKSRLKGSEGLFRTLAEGQSPKAMVISCCDSRVDPTVIFDAQPGDLFMVRNVANLVPPYTPTGGYHGVSAALEFAVTGLNIEHILIMGHRSCGGIQACLDGHYEKAAGGSFIGKWMSILEPARARVLERYGNAPREEQQRALEEEGIRQSIANVQEFPFVRERMGKETLSVHGGYFDIGSATLYAMDGGTGEFLPMPEP